MEKSEQFSKKSIHNFTNSDYKSNHLKKNAKNLEAILMFVVFSKAFDSILRRKMEQILLTYSFPRETVSAIMMHYKNTKAMVRSPDSDTDFFDLVARVLKGDTLASFLFILCLVYILLTLIDLMKEKWSHTKKQEADDNLLKLSKMQITQMI